MWLVWNYQWYTVVLHFWISTTSNPWLESVARRWYSWQGFEKHTFMSLYRSGRCPSFAHFLARQWVGYRLYTNTKWNTKLWTCFHQIVTTSFHRTNRQSRQWLSLQRQCIYAVIREFSLQWSIREWWQQTWPQQTFVTGMSLLSLSYPFHTSSLVTLTSRNQHSRN